MKNVFKILIIGASVFIAACNNPSATDNSTSSKDTTANNAGSVEAYIRKAASNFQQEIERSDSNAMAAHYAADAIVMPPNSEPVQGNKIVNLWGGAIRMGVKGLKLNITNISGDGDIYAETGTYEMLGTDNKSMDKGKYVVVWKKNDGNWKMYRDIWNSNMPSAAAK